MAFAGATDADVAHHDHRCTDRFAVGDRALYNSRRPRTAPEQQAERPQQHGDQIQGITMAIQPVHGQGVGDELVADGGGAVVGAAFIVAISTCLKPSWRRLPAPSPPPGAGFGHRR